MGCTAVVSMIIYARHEVKLGPDGPQHDNVEVVAEVTAHKTSVRGAVAGMCKLNVPPYEEEEYEGIDLGRVCLNVVQQF